VRPTAAFAALGWALVLVACGLPGRDNPADPDGPGEDEDPGIELIALIPEGGFTGDRFAEIRYTVTAADLPEDLLGPMNLVGDRASALVRGIPIGTDRVIVVDAFDPNEIRTFSASDTIEITASAPTSVSLLFRRLTGTIEISSDLPPEITQFEVSIAADGDTVSFSYEVSGGIQERISDIPTGTGVLVGMSGIDAEQQVLLQSTELANVQSNFVTHIAVNAVIGVLQIQANFPGYIPVVAIDRFSDVAGTFFKRSERQQLPAADEPIDFDEDFLMRSLGPNGEVVEQYHLDARPSAPALVFVAVDFRGDLIAGQLPVFDDIPGDVFYNDVRRVVEVEVERDYRPNAVTSWSAMMDAQYDTTMTERVLHCVMVPDGSVASKRFVADIPLGLHDGWYREQIVKYLLFENPESSLTIDFAGNSLSTPIMYAFLQNDRDVSDGFAIDTDGNTHNVVTLLPGQEGYSPLWALTLFILDAFDRVVDVPSAQSQAGNPENRLELEDGAVILVNAPIVAVLPSGS
jgi:hypothetical protein